MLWAVAGVITLGFLVALEIVARGYGLGGPIANQVREVIFPPRSGFVLYGSMALMMVVLTWRQRLVSFLAALGVDAVFLLVRWVADIKVTEGHPFGNGALWVIVGWAVIAVTRRAGEERLHILKGVALGLLLVTGRKIGDTWLLITSKTRPQVLDQYVATADHALGNPSWLVGRIVEATGVVGSTFLHIVYAQLPAAAVAVAFYQLRNVATERRFPRHHLVHTFLVIGLLGPAIYMIFPVVGPVYAFSAEGGHWALADLWPNTLPSLGTPQHMPFDEITPRNCMPSLHTAWATAIFLHSRNGPRALRFAGTGWLIATLTATLGFGYHYGADLVAGVVFTLTIEAGLRAFERGWDRSATQLVAYGTAVFTALLVAYRWLPTQMAAYPWLFGPLLLLALASVIHLYVRTTRAWDPKAAPVPQPQPQPELA
ncbi:phosphatase PAP2 family protein [Streptomyces sp. NPDC052051]|uniref:phosphatase PAP2 family protein n=1 Tax=Streptomyces sp. NPDC052051 TaxID=3154649 RepID=UPI0034356CA8